MKSKIGKKLVIIEVVCFIIIIFFLWLDEVLDLPHYCMGAPATPINTRESIFESICILLLAIPVIFISIRLLKQLEYFESCLIVCALCKKIKIKDEWIPVERFLSQKYETEFSPSLCSECAIEHYKYVNGGK